MKRIRLLLWIVSCWAMAALVVSATAVAPTSAPADQVTTAGSPAPDAAPLDGPTNVDQVVALVNQERWTNGQLPPLKGVSELHSSSQVHSDNMAAHDFFAHCDLNNGSLPWDRMVAAGYNYNSAGENIAAGYDLPTSVMAGWMASSGHRANILSTGYREIGVGYTYQGTDLGNIRGDQNGDCVADQFNKGPYYRYWTQNFGRRNSVYPVVINREAYETDSTQVDLYVYGEGWATQMRFRNENGSWSSWQSYSTDTSWTLSSGNGVKTVHAEIRNGGDVRSSSDTIMLSATVVQPEINLSPNNVTVLRAAGSTALEQVTLRISNGGTEPLDWSIAEQPAAAWLSAAPASGSTGGGGQSTSVVTIDPAGIAVGTHTAQLEVSGNATNSPQNTTVTLIVSDQVYHAYLPLVTRD